MGDNRHFEVARAVKIMELEYHDVTMKLNQAIEELE